MIHSLRYRYAHVAALAAITAALGQGCGGDDARATPSTIYKGRVNEVSVAAPDASFSDDASASVNGGGAKVASTRAVTDTQLVVGVDVPLDFSGRSLTLVADDEPITLAVTDALTASPEPGFSLPQGATTVVELTNSDAAHPLDALSLAVDAGTGVDVFVDDRSPSTLTLTLHALPTAAAGPHDLLVSLNDTAGKAVASARIDDAFAVEARTIVPVTPGVPVNVTVPAGEDGAYLQLSGAAGKLLDVRVTSAKMGGQSVTPFLAIVTPEKGLVLPESALTGDELLAPVSGDVFVYVGPADGSPDMPTDLTVVLDALTPVMGGEAEPNEMVGQASALSMPALVQAELGTDTDVDVFAIDVPAPGTLLVRTLSGPKGELADTHLTVEDANGMVLGENDDEDAGMNDSLSFVRASVTQPGKVYVTARVGFGGFGFGAPYRMAAALR